MGLETTAIIAIGAAVASVGAGVASTISQSNVNKKNIQLQNETNALNYQMFQEQLGFTEKMQDKQNAYNTPVEQRRRFEQAGVNPYLAMTNLSSGNAELASTPSVNPAQAAHVQPNLGLAQILENLGKSVTDVQQIQMMAEQVNAQREAVIKARKENLYYDMRTRADIEEQMSRIDKNTEEWKNLKRQRDLLDLDIDLGRKTLNAKTRRAESEADLAYNLAYSEQLKANYQSIINDTFPDIQKATLAKLRSETQVCYSQMNLNQRLSETEIKKQANLVTEQQIKVLEKANIPIQQAQENAIRQANYDYIRASNRKLIHSDNIIQNYSPLVGSSAAGNLLK